MKKKLLMHRLRNTCALAALLIPSAVLGQDNYWLLNIDANQGITTYLNTATQAVASYSGLAGYYSGARVRTVFNASGNEMFSYGKDDASKFSSDFLGHGAEQAFLIPNNCKQYYLLSLIPNPGPHVTSMSLTRIDASGSGQPVVLSTVGLANLDAFNYGAVAGKLDVNGNRKLYFLTRTWTNNSTCDLYSYTIAPNGNVSSGSYTMVRAGLPQCSGNALMKMAPDGNSLAFTDANNQMVTVDVNSGAFTSYGKVALGMAEVTVGSVRRWYVSTGTELGYFAEGGSSFTLISNTLNGSNGINSDIALGKDGNLYVAKGNPASTTGTLLYFPPSTHVFNTVPGAQIVGVNKTGAPTAYSFGNNVEGEDINLSQAPASVSFTLNGLAGPATAVAPDTLWACPGASTVPLSATVTGMHTSYSYLCHSGILVNGIFTATGPAIGSGPMAGYGPTFSMPFNLGSVATAIRLTFSVTGACGNTISKTQYYEIKLANVLADYLKSGCAGGCFKPIQTTLPITTPAPAINSSIAVFRANIDAALGWMGANFAGLYDINTNGNWTMSVYEVDGTTGARMIRNGITSPIVSAENGSGPRTGALRFNDYGLGIDPGNPPYYVDVTSNFGDGAYFVGLYNHAKSGVDPLFTLTDFSNRVYCAELNVFEPTSGCSASKKSYFKIANNGSFSNGNNAKQAPNDEENLLPVSIYPNPVSTTLTIAIPAETTQASVELMDNLGRLVGKTEYLQIGKNSIDMQRLPSGVYFYNLSVNGKIQHGKIVKQ